MVEDPFDLRGRWQWRNLDLPTRSVEPMQIAVCPYRNFNMEISRGRDVAGIVERRDVGPWHHGS